MKKNITKFHTPHLQWMRFMTVEFSGEWGVLSCQPAHTNTLQKQHQLAASHPQPWVMSIVLFTHQIHAYLQKTNK